MGFQCFQHCFEYIYIHHRIPTFLWDTVSSSFKFSFFPGKDFWSFLLLNFLKMLFYSFFESRAEYSKMRAPRERCMRMEPRKLHCQSSATVRTCLGDTHRHECTHARTHWRYLTKWNELEISSNTQIDLHLIEWTIVKILCMTRRKPLLILHHCFHRQKIESSAREFLGKDGLSTLAAIVV